MGLGQKRQLVLFSIPQRLRCVSYGRRYVSQAIFSQLRVLPANHALQPTYLPPLRYGKSAAELRR